MRNLLRKTAAGMLLIAALILLILTNLGWLSFREPYIRLLAEPGPAAALVAFVNVDVIPMDSDRVVPGQTVVVRDGVIAQIGDAGTVEVPEAALVLDGEGKYLMPGLVDMHVHVQDENDLLLLAANGITTVRNMWGNTGLGLRLGLADQLALREQIQRGELFGPTIYTAGPILEGDPPTQPLMHAYRTPAEAEAAVAWQAAQGYDFVKVYDHLDTETYQAILRAATANGLPVVGHAPIVVGLGAVLGGGQLTIEHLSGYIDADAAEFLIPEDQIDTYAARTKAAGVWNCPTLGVYRKNSLPPEAVQRLERQPAMRYLSPGARALNGFLYSQMSQGHTYAGDDYASRMAALQNRLVRALRDAGAGLLLGTDAANPYHLPGYATHEELELLVEAGLSPYEALRAGTANAAEALGRPDSFGRVAEGMRADLLLLEANPLENVGNARRLAGVMLRGRWLPKELLQEMLDGLAGSYSPTVFERLWPLGLLGLGLWLTLRRAREPQTV